MKKLIILIFSLIILLQTQTAFGETEGHIPKPDNNIIIIQHVLVKYPTITKTMGTAVFPESDLQYIEGELINTSNKTLDKIMLKARFYDGQGLRAEDSTITVKPILRQGEATYFSFTTPLTFPSCYEVWVDSYQIGSDDKVSESLEIIEFAIDYDKPDFIVKVKNNAQKTLEVWGILTGYDNNKIKIALESERAELIPRGSTEQLEFLTNTQYAPSIRQEFLNFIKTDSYEVFAISIEADRTDQRPDTVFDKWFSNKTSIC